MQSTEDIPVPVDDPVLLEYMLQYLYGLDYMEEPAEDVQEKPRRYEEDFMWGQMKHSRRQSNKKKSSANWASWEDGGIPGLEAPRLGTLESDSSKKVSSDGNAVVHTKMCAIADFYGIPDLQKVARRKFSCALDKINDIQGIVEVFKLVCHPGFQSDVVLCDLMVDKIATNTNLLDEPDIAEILQEDGQLALAIAKRMRSKQVSVPSW